VIIVAIDDQFAGDCSNVNDMTIQDAIPYIDSHYSTYADADYRGLYGYSWGGGYAFNVGCANLDYFHYLGPTAAAPNKAGDNTLFPNGGANAKQVLKCLFISWGQNDYTSIKDASVACVNYCNNNGISNYSWEAQGQGHSAGTWKHAMWNFLQLADQAGISGNADPNDIWLEAEFRTMGSLWDTLSDSTASNGKYVNVQPGNNSTSNAPADTSGYITYGFKINDSGTYTVWGRVKITTTDDDAFWVKMDSTAWFSWDSIPPSTTWIWAKIDTFKLDKGGHSFTVAYNKDGALLDKLFITRTDSIPSGMGGLAFNTLPGNTSPFAYAGVAMNIVDTDGTGTETLLLNSIGSSDPDGYIVS
jgi:hypothetical protein